MYIYSLILRVSVTRIIYKNLQQIIQIKTEFRMYTQVEFVIELV